MLIATNIVDPYQTSRNMHSVLSGPTVFALQ